MCFQLTLLSFVFQSVVYSTVFGDEDTFSSEILSDLERRNLTLCETDSCNYFNSDSIYLKPNCFCDDKCRYFDNCCFDFLFVDGYDHNQYQNVFSTEKSSSCRTWTKSFKTNVVSRCHYSYNGTLRVQELCHVASSLMYEPIFEDIDTSYFTSKDKKGKQIVLANLLAGIEETDPLIIIPVINRQNNLIFNNFYCGICNGFEENELYMWPLNLACPETQGTLKTNNNELLNIQKRELYIYGDNEKISEDLIGQHLPADKKDILPFNTSIFSKQFYDCKIELKFAEDIYFGTECYSEVSHCPSNYASNEVSRYCSMYSSLVQDSAGVIYKNPHCALCNGINNYQCFNDKRMHTEKELMEQMETFYIVSSIIMFFDVVIAISYCLHLLAFCILSELRNLPGRNLASFTLCCFLLHVAYSIVEVSGRNCIYIQVASYVIYFASLGWTNVIAYDVYATLKSGVRNLSVPSNTNKRYLLYLAYVSVLTAVMTVVGFLLRLNLIPGLPDWLKFYNCSGFTEEAFISVTYGPLIALMSVNLGFFLMTARVLQISRRQSLQQNISAHGVIFSIVYWQLIVMMGLVWALVFLQYVLENIWFLLGLFLVIRLQGIWVFVSFTPKLALINRLKELACSSPWSLKEMTTSKNCQTTKKYQGTKKCHSVPIPTICPESSTQEVIDLDYIVLVTNSDQISQIHNK